MATDDGLIGGWLLIFGVDCLGQKEGQQRPNTSWNMV